MHRFQPGATNRIAWISTAKGFTILLVVLGHVEIQIRAEGAVHPLWAVAGHALATVRMPTFFLLSGLFASRTFHRSWREVFDEKVYPFVYLYIVWSLIYIPVQIDFSPFSGLTPAEAALSWIQETIKGSGFLWYFAALAVFFSLTWALRRVPVGIQVSLSGALSTVFAMQLVGTGSWGARSHGAVPRLLSRRVPRLLDDSKSGRTDERSHMFGVVRCMGISRDRVSNGREVDPQHRQCGLTSLGGATCSLRCRAHHKDAGIEAV
ncbi:acyltransferase family protein [Microbacterium sp. nov. GSS16]|uniref:acyltransferase family protein n=1 Tax=Microbacterium sp. nov. GSS16 TaxID=3019890 RepID=UPI0023059D0E|nr:acyltransferase family protein [Microbacterium sp. nov. GSS16]WCD92892.1 acyltransferase family protein [Microbacterium sp. nov. GSS16]